MTATASAALLHRQAQGHCRLEHPDPDDPNLGKHALRYEFALPLAREARVVDVACGTGYGTRRLAMLAREARGFDISPRAIAEANEGNNPDHLEFAVGNATALPLPDASVDLLVSFETIEHLEDPRAFLHEIRRLLAPGGRVLLSTPNKRFSTPDRAQPYNPFHLVEWQARDFVALVRETFPRLEVFGQVRIHDAHAVQVSAVRYFVRQAQRPHPLRTAAGRVATSLGIKQALKQMAGFVLPRPRREWVPFLWGEQELRDATALRQAFAVTRTEQPEDFLVTLVLAHA